MRSLSEEGSSGMVKEKDVVGAGTTKLNEVGDSEKHAGTYERPVYGGWIKTNCMSDCAMWKIFDMQGLECGCYIRYAEKTLSMMYGTEAFKPKWCGTVKVSHCFRSNVRGTLGTAVVEADRQRANEGERICALLRSSRNNLDQLLWCTLVEKETLFSSLMYTSQNLVASSNLIIEDE
ncbi:unnamed protein product [Citrullus colocynthis]|uniref:Uncharacterized protein n=1 Tax=Citrullus colocynthis TaxID=252529 RepID=A0ABP0Y2S2_9ROSI